jgi:subtilase family serine protease
VLEYVSAPGTGPYLTCPGCTPCSAGWYVIGGTSASSPELAGIVATADQQAGRPLGFINPALYRMAADPATYATDFFDVTTGTNTQLGSTTTGFDAGPGWDAVTGLGTPGFNGPGFIRDLVAAARPND